MNQKSFGGGLALCLVLLMLSACADDPVTTPDGQPIVFSGELEQGESISEDLILVEPGTIRIELTEAEALLIEVPPSGEIPLFTIGVGIGNSTGGNCSITFGSSLFEGDNLTVLVEDTEACLLIFDDGTLPPDAVISYEITVEDLAS